MTNEAKGKSRSISYTRVGCIDKNKKQAPNNSYYDLYVNKEIVKRKLIWQDLLDFIAEIEEER